jgi:hypothetical protein
MDEPPTDLMTLADVLKEFKPRRQWWEIRIRNGEITAYRVPGTRAIHLSRADVERLLRPQRLAIRPEPRREVVKRGDESTEPETQEPTE